MSGTGTEGEARGAGRHAAPRHAARPTEPVRLDTSRLHALPSVAPEPDPAVRRGSLLPLFLLALGITAAVVAWGYLVYLAIDFGTTARDGDRTAWWYLGLATVGAIACLFFGMMLVARLVARVRGGAPAAAPPRSPGTPGTPGTPRAPGGRRAAR